MVAIFEIMFGGRMGGGAGGRGGQTSQRKKEILAIFEITQNSEHKIEYTK